MSTVDALIQESNSYIQQDVKENNRRVVEVLQQQRHLVELEDLELFATFQIDVAPDSKERRTAHKLF
jgi:hypothetical protein